MSAPPINLNRFKRQHIINALERSLAERSLVDYIRLAWPLLELEVPLTAVGREFVVPPVLPITLRKDKLARAEAVTPMVERGDVAGSRSFRIAVAA
jgi:hypothetical protein